jgi:hypothetical protein
MTTEQWVKIRDALGQEVDSLRAQLAETQNELVARRRLGCIDRDRIATIEQIAQGLADALREWAPGNDALATFDAYQKQRQGVD